MLAVMPPPAVWKSAADLVLDAAHLVIASVNSAKAKDMTMAVQLVGRVGVPLRSHRPP